MTRAAAVTMAELGERLGLRPLSARSVISSVLLDDGSQGISTAALVRLAGLFDISDNAARVALSRLGVAGEVRSEGGRHWPAGPLVTSRDRIVVHRWPTTGPWDGTWSMQVVTAEGRTHQERQALRRAMGGIRHAELAPGCWVRPDNVTSAFAAGDEAVVAEQCHRFTSTPREPAADLVARLWDLPRWHDRAVLLIDLVRRLRPQLEAGDLTALAPGWVLSAAIVTHGATDPLLPVELLPSGWRGEDLPGELAEHHQVWRRLLRSWSQRS